MYNKHVCVCVTFSDNPCVLIADGQIWSQWARPCSSTETDTLLSSTGSKKRQRDKKTPNLDRRTARRCQSSWPSRRSVPPITFETDTLYPTVLYKCHDLFWLLQALVAEIEQNQTKLDECQTHSKQYCTSVKVRDSFCLCVKYLSVTLQNIEICYIYFNYFFIYIYVCLIFI